MKRDKIITLRQDSNLLKQVQEIIDKHTRVEESYHHKYYYCDLAPRGWLSNKYTIADILEKALIDFVEQHKEDLNV